MAEWERIWSSALTMSTYIEPDCRQRRCAQRPLRPAWGNIGGKLIYPENASPYLDIAVENTHYNYREQPYHVAVAREAASSGRPPGSYHPSHRHNYSTIGNGL